MPIQKILKIGNSLGITIPSPIIQSLSLKAGNRVEISRSQNNTINLTFPDSHQLSLELPKK